MTKGETAHRSYDRSRPLLLPSAPTLHAAARRAFEGDEQF
jgi:hypothetical protein